MFAFLAFPPKMFSRITHPAYKLPENTKTFINTRNFKHLNFDVTILCKFSIFGLRSNITPRRSLAFSWKNRVITGRNNRAVSTAFRLLERRMPQKRECTCHLHASSKMFVDDINFPVRVWIHRGSIRKYTSFNYSFKRGQSALLISVVKAPEKKSAVRDRRTGNNWLRIRRPSFFHPTYFFFFFLSWNEFDKGTWRGYG